MLPAEEDSSFTIHYERGSQFNGKISARGGEAAMGKTSWLLLSCVA